MKFVVMKYNKEGWYEHYRVCKTLIEAQQEEKVLKKTKEKTYIAIKQSLRAAGITVAHSCFLEHRSLTH